MRPKDRTVTTCVRKIGCYRSLTGDIIITPQVNLSPILMRAAIGLEAASFSPGLLQQKRSTFLKGLENRELSSIIKLLHDILHDDDKGIKITPRKEGNFSLVISKVRPYSGNPKAFIEKVNESLNNQPFLTMVERIAEQIRKDMEAVNEEIIQSTL